MQNISVLSTDDLQNILDSKNTKIIDARSVDAYNGWKLKGEARGGNIKGAKSLPLKWTKYMVWTAVVQ